MFAKTILAKVVAFTRQEQLGMEKHLSLNNLYICPRIIDLTCLGLLDTLLSICCLQSWCEKGETMKFICSWLIE